MSKLQKTEKASMTSLKSNHTNEKEPANPRRVRLLLMQRCRAEAKSEPKRSERQMEGKLHGQPYRAAPEVGVHPGTRSR